MSWVRKYRPQQVAQLHLTQVRQTLLNMMKAGKIPQVLLFAGPKGTGKTSTARIIGALLNDPANAPVVDWQYFKKTQPQDVQLKEPDMGSEFAQQVYTGQSFVVQEMDAASNRGIDDVRLLKDRVMLPPQQGKMAVYILDEAHMFTSEAFNALLKMLEEPPAHAVFILATTEKHKIPATVASRCSLIEFTQASVDEILVALQSVLKSEQIKPNQDALQLIAHQAEGSFRDAVKLLELACQAGSLDLKQVKSLLGGEVQTQVKQLLDLVLAKDEAGVAKLFAHLRSQNLNASFFYKMLVNFLHQSLLQSLAVVPGQPYCSQTVSAFLLEEILTVPWQAASPVPFLSLELKLLKLIERSKNKGGAGGNQKKTPPPVLTSDHHNKSAASTLPSAPLDTVVTSTPAVAAAALLAQSTPSGSSVELIARWEELIATVARQNATVAALLRSSKPIIGVNGEAKIGVFYKFHQEQLQNPKFRQIIDQCCEQLVGGRVELDFLLQTTPSQAELVDQPANRALTELVEEALLNS